MPRSSRTTSSKRTGAKAPAGATAAGASKSPDGVVADGVSDGGAPGSKGPDAEDVAAVGSPPAASVATDPGATSPEVTASEVAASEPPAAPAPRPPAPSRAAPKPMVKPKVRGPEDPFLLSQREALMSERGNYVKQADELKAQADSLALEHEPGDVQFDEEGGEGGTSNVDRELDLLLSAQARGAVEEIDRALTKIDAGTYGRCEQCGQDILEARLEALPHAALCVTCKAGGLSSRR